MPNFRNDYWYVRWAVLRSVASFSILKTCWLILPVFTVANRKMSRFSSTSTMERNFLKFRSKDLNFCKPILIFWEWLKESKLKNLLYVFKPLKVGLHNNMHSAIFLKLSFSIHSFNLILLSLILTTNFKIIFKTKKSSF